jgi:hypothetical protein
MPARKTEEELALAARLKVARTVVRLKHSLQADRELNVILSDISDDHNHELQSGGLKQLNPGMLDDMLKDVVDE